MLIHIIESLTIYIYVYICIQLNYTKQYEKQLELVTEFSKNRCWEREEILSLVYSAKYLSDKLRYEEALTCIEFATQMQTEICLNIPHVDDIYQDILSHNGFWYVKLKKKKKKK